MSIWLAIANPYAYDRAMGKAIAEAQQLQIALHVAFFISSQSLGATIHDMAETGWLGSASLHNLESCLMEGYEALGGDVLKRVSRKVKKADESLELIIEGIVKEKSLQKYIETILNQEVTKIIIAGSNSLTPKLANLPDKVEYTIEE